MSTNHKFKIGLAAVVVLLFGILTVMFLKPGDTVRSARANPKIGRIVESVYGLGTVTPDQVFHLRTGVALTVEDVFVHEGVQVAPKEPLIKLDETTWRSPIQGTLTSILYKKGEMISPQATVLTVTDLNDLFLEVSLEQQSIMRVKKDQSVVVSFESLRNEKYSGRVTSVYPRESQFIARIDLDQWPTGILPGMTADIAILIAERESALMIPLQSVSAGQVVRYRNGKKERIPVKLGVVDGEWAEVVSGNLEPSDQVRLRR